MKYMQKNILKSLIIIHIIIDDVLDSFKKVYPVFEKSTSWFCSSILPNNFAQSLKDEIEIAES